MDTPPSYIAIFLVATILVITAVLGVLLALLMMGQRRQRNFRLRLLAQQAIHARDMLQSQVEIQEQTFRNIAQEIHDNINLSLTMAKLTLHELAGAGAPAEGVEATLKLISDAIGDLSAISRGLNSDIIQQQGLLNAVDAEVERIHRCTRLRIVLDVTGETVFLPFAQELFLFRIIQESFNNILKHARAQNALLRLEFRAERILVTIADDGIGFREEELDAKKGKSTGLHTMRSRLEQAHGSFRVETKHQQGTTLFMELPINSDDNNNDHTNSAGRRPRAAAQCAVTTDQRL